MKRKRVGDDGEEQSAQLVERAPPPMRPWKQDRRFGVVIDAGSSGSRIQVYSWLDHEVAKEQRQARGDGIAVLPKVEKGVEQGEGWTMKVEPGRQEQLAIRASHTPKHRITINNHKHQYLSFSRHLVARRQPRRHRRLSPSVV